MKTFKILLSIFLALLFFFESEGQTQKTVTNNKENQKNDDFWNSSSSQGNQNMRDSDFWNSSSNKASDSKSKNKDDEFWNKTSSTIDIKYNELIFYKNIGFKNKNGELIIKAEYDYARGFSEGLCAVEHNGKWGFINTKGQLIIPCMYDFVKMNFKEGIAKVGHYTERKEINNSGINYYTSSFALGTCIYINKNNARIGEPIKTFKEYSKHDIEIVLEVFIERQLTEEEQKRNHRKADEERATFYRKRKEYRESLINMGYTNFDAL